ncbi:ABC transporter substrate-binding protein [Ideonella sp. A 288]|uniref:ABC transporter substrate-binding protein n=1 Tax=Ideonella sp. A 288 TaxID=1962181 RepID=UPI000B4AE768|nr:ABC transporter substrate-binding protein [Ideonella sp. A 288]
MMSTRSILAGLWVAAWLPLAQAQPAPAPPVRIGLILPLSGGSSDFGTSARHGAEMAVAEINAVGGFLGRPLQLVVRDDKGTPDVGRAAAVDLVAKERVDYTVGFCNTGVALAALDVFESHKHLLMVPCSTGTAVTHKTPAAQSHVFRVAPPDDMTARFLAREIVDRRKLGKVAILADRTGYGDGGVRDLGAELARRGLQPLVVLRFDLGVQSLRDELQAARAAGADVVVNYTVGPEHAVALKARAAMGWRVPYLAAWPLSFRSVLQNAGPAAIEGALMAQTIIQDNANERRASFLARYFKHSNDRPIGSLMSAAQTYDAVHLMLRALFQSKGDTSGPALKTALEDLREPYRGVVTTFDKPFTRDDHEAFSDRMIWLGEWRNGSIEYHHASDARLSSVMRRKNEP